MLFVLLSLGFPRWRVLELHCHRGGAGEMDRTCGSLLLE